MDKNKEKLQEARAKLDNLEKNFKELRGDMTVKPADDLYCKIMDNLYYSLQGIRDYIYRIEDNFYNHTSTSNGHLPQIRGAEKYENALKILEINKDFEVKKPVIYVQANRQGNKEFIAELNIPKKQ